ncbi:MAG: phosphoenolpyruvate carboxykinase domain-containing protein, partial [Candidatus Poribacteria bacterium]
GTAAAHPNSRFTVSIYQCPNLSKEFDNPKGVPISAIIFGGRRSKLMPLVVESFNWQHGVFSGARMGSETTSAAEQKLGELRRDPMAMLPFCGYNMGDYFGHWLNMGKKMTQPPKIFSVNWFRTDDEGKFIWPGFGENIRVLKWIVDRIKNRIQAKETTIGLMPHLEDLNLDGLNINREKLKKLFEIKPQDWDPELKDIQNFFGKFGDRLPQEIVQEYNALTQIINSV